LLKTNNYAEPAFATQKQNYITFERCMYLRIRTMYQSVYNTRGINIPRVYLYQTYNNPSWLGLR